MHWELFLSSLGTGLCYTVLLVFLVGSAMGLAYVATRGLFHLILVWSLILLGFGLFMARQDYNQKVEQRERDLEWHQQYDLPPNESRIPGVVYPPNEIEC